MKSLTLTSSMIFAALLSSSGWAIDNAVTVCSHMNQQRIIEVAYPTRSALPCEVRYIKPEGSSVLWTARNETGYCEQRAAEFIIKQKKWGWNCESNRNAQ